MKLIKILSCLLIASLVSACEDSANLDFKEEYYVEGFLIVGEPVQEIRIQRTQSVATPFQYANGKVVDATVRLFVGESPNPILLTYRADSTGKTVGDYASLLDTVRAETRYRLEVVFQDGKRVEAETTTPKRIEWVRAPRPLIQLPTKSNASATPDSLRILWSSVSQNAEYLIRATCLDTLGYGIYLNPSVNEPNKRTWVVTDEGDETRYNSRSVWGFLQGTSSPTVWAIFKWYGKHEIVLYAADVNFTNWFKFLRFQGNPQYESNFSNVRGDGKGIFGSASVVKQETFVLKESQ